MVRFIHVACSIQYTNTQYTTFTNIIYYNDTAVTSDDNLCTKFYISQHLFLRTQRTSAKVGGFFFETIESLRDKQFFPRQKLQNTADVLFICWYLNRRDDWN